MVTALKKEGIRLGVWEQCKGGMELTIAGRKYVEQILGYEGINRCLYHQLMKSEEAKERYVNWLSEKYRTAFNSRPSVDVTLDQAQCTVQTAFRRALLCLTYGTLIGKHILCLGDDDFVCLAIGFLLKELFPARDTYPTDILVLDVDKRYIEYLQQQAKQCALPINCEQIDLRLPFPVHLSGRF